MKENNRYDLLMNKKDETKSIHAFRSDVVDKEGKPRQYLVLFPDIDALNDKQLYSFIFIELYDRQKSFNLMKGYERWLCKSNMDLDTLKIRLKVGDVFEFDLPMRSFVDQVHNYRISHNMTKFFHSGAYLMEFYRFKNKSFVIKNIEAYNG